MARYQVDVYLPLEEKTTADPGVRFYLQALYANPLGLGQTVNLVMSIYMPFYMVLTVSLICFALWVFRSIFLRNLITQPCMLIYLRCHLILILTGPWYVWLVQFVGFHLNVSQLYSCFLLLWAHNSAMISTSNLLILMILERAVTIGRPESVWAVWRKSCRKIAYLIITASMVYAGGGLLCIHGEELVLTYKQDPICMPWWDNERGTDHRWYKLVAIGFSLLPCVAVIFSLMFLMVQVGRFRLVLRSGVEALNHYNALFIEIKATLHFKFIKTLTWLGLLFVLMCGPVGVFICVGPFIKSRLELREQREQKSLKDLQVLANRTGTDNSTTPTPVPEDTAYSAQYNAYARLSRSDAETIVWMVYYSFSLLVVPVLLSTEILFYREFKGRTVQVMNFILCRKVPTPQWSGLDFFTSEMAPDQLVGPYVARSDEYLSSARTPVTEKEVKVIRVYDASKAVKAGRVVTGASLAGSKKTSAADVSRQKPVPAARKQTAVKNTKAKKAEKPAQQKRKAFTRKSNSQEVQHPKSDDSSST
ncbi:uncharacterized protein LOC131937666 [Physella acuta]|uniref:uncharacterized protein LOC131937666 n=1 Tax=Physella acuta TaxID=109671 RepID=UPI0027DC8826|nr:uncharacterized protein LOC131937666 [Physella acuta]XP_059151242.1 uncharacterized protein LOC131937666 [Physella acuta]